MKKTTCVICGLLFFAAALFAQGGTEKTETSSADDGKLKGTLVVATNSDQGTFDAVQEIINRFMKENPGVKVEFTTYTKDYEDLMKAKMAANDLPDVFATHGWAVGRYAEYLRPLNDLPFASHLSDGILRQITTKDGNIVTLPLTMEFSGVLYNRDVLKKIGWDHTPKTWDEFLEACEAAKNIGVNGVYISGKNTNSQAYILDIMADTFLCTYPGDDNSEALLNGTFDWSKWSRVAGYLKTLVDKGYVNKDVNTADSNFRAEKLANGETLFMFQNLATIADAWKLNPDADLSIMPVPTLYPDDEPIMNANERESYGIWKDTKNMDAAIALVEFMARPENIKYVCEETGMPTAFKDVEIDSRLSPDFKKYSNLRTYRFFDQAYLPSGMWAILRTTGAGITSGEITVDEACQIMKENYDSLRSQAQ